MTVPVEGARNKTVTFKHKEDAAYEFINFFSTLSRRGHCDVFQGQSISAAWYRTHG